MKQLTLIQDKEIEKKLKIETEKINIIRTTTNKLRKDIQNAKKPIIILGGDDKINRLALENKNVDILLSPERGRRKDYMFFRNAGLNQVLCKIAQKNNVAIGFNFSDILNASDKERPKILARMAQNVKLCKKYKVKMIFSTFATEKYELRNNENLTNFSCFLGN
jgi:ribonuclease P/MRP protein subunit RPP1